MEVKPHEHIVVKVDGSQRLTLMNMRFVHQLDPLNEQDGRRRAARTATGSGRTARVKDTSGGDTQHHAVRVSESMYNRTVQCAYHK